VAGRDRIAFDSTSGRLVRLKADTTVVVNKATLKGSPHEHYFGAL